MPLRVPRPAGAAGPGGDAAGEPVSRLQPRPRPPARLEAPPL